MCKMPRNLSVLVKNFEEIFKIALPHYPHPLKFILYRVIWFNFI